MQLQDFIKQPKKLTKKSIEFEGQKLTFYVRQESAYDQLNLLENSGDLMSAIMNLQKARESDENAEYKPTGSEAAALKKHRARQVFYLACNQDGAPFAKDLDSMLKVMSPDLIEKLGEAIDTAVTVDDAEKN
jgi:hypothetical protein